MRRFKCSVCGYVYDESAGIPVKGIPPGTKWEDLPDNFVCPLCTAPKSVFKPLDNSGISEKAADRPATPAASVNTKDIKGLSAGEISAIFSSLAKGCEKQRLLEEMDAFNRLAEYFNSKTAPEPGKTLKDAAEMLEKDLAEGFALANAAAKESSDRGAQRSLVWSEKVSIMAKSLLDRFAKEGDAMLENTKIYVCDICGFIITGDAPPEICPVCKVPSFKILQIER